MSRTLEALKALAVKCTSAASAAAVTGETVDEVIDYIEANFNVDGEDGKSVTAIALTTTEGAVTGGTATFSDGTTAAITVTGT